MASVFDVLVCKACRKVPLRPHVSCCCNELFCHRCAAAAAVCATCGRPLRTAFSPFVRRTLDPLPMACEYCGAQVAIAAYEQHVLETCARRPRRCAVPDCSFAAADVHAFGQHVLREHGDLFDAAFALPAASNRRKQKDVRVKWADQREASRIPSFRVNGCGRKVWLGVTEKYYCGQPVLDCKCCSLICGPNNGCNCVDCMALDVARRRLPRGCLVNSSGAVAQKHEASELYFCERFYAIAKCDTQCSAKTGVQCIACASISDDRYAGIND